MVVRTGIRLENPLTVSLSFLIVGAVLFFFGLFIYRNPERFIGIPFVRGVGGWNFSDKSLNKSYEKRYGRESAIKKMKLNGAVLMIISAAIFVFGLLKIL